MIEFITITIIIILIIKYFSKNKGMSNSKKKVISNNSNSLLYKEKGIRVFDIKGAKFRNLNPNKHNGEFVGNAKLENNKHDRYAVAIYNDKNNHLGYVPKGNKRLNNSIAQWHNGKILVWGHLYQDKYNKNWYGKVYIPIGYSSEQLEKIKDFLIIRQENENLIKDKEKSTEKFFKILQNHSKIDNLLKELNYPEELYYLFPRNLIPTISKHLEKEKNWVKLIELEKYQDLIDELSDNFKNSTLNRISKAKSNIKKI